MKPPFLESASRARERERSASRPGADTPTSNRGVGISSPLTIAPHWLAATVHKSLGAVASAYVEDFHDLPDMSWAELDRHWFVALDRSIAGYAGGWQGRDGVKIYAYPSTGQHCHLVMSGTVLERHTIDSIRRFLLRYVDETEFEEFLAGGKRPDIRITRFDIAIDHCPFSPRTVFDAMDRGDFRSKSRPGAWYPDTGTGSTVYLGSKKSDKQLRVYDRRGPTRLELQFRRIPAFVLCMEAILCSSDEWPAHAVGVVRSMVDFVDRKSNATQSPLLPWWEEFIGAAIEVRLPTAADTPDSIAKLRGYVERIAPSVKALLHYDGRSADEFFQHVQLGDRQVRLLESVGHYFAEDSVA